MEKNRNNFRGNFWEIIFKLLKENKNAVTTAGRPSEEQKQRSKSKIETVQVQTPKMSKEEKCNKAAKKHYKEINERFAHALNAIESDEAVEMNLDFESWFRKCFFLWKEMQKLQGNYRQANKILTGFYATDGIRSQLERIVAYAANRLLHEKNAENIVLRGFNGIIDYIWLDYQKLIKSAKAEQTNAKMNDKEQMICFFMEFSSQNERMANLTEAYCKGILLYEQNEKADDIEELHEQLKRSWKDMKSENAAERFSLPDIYGQLQNREKSITEKIAESECIMDALSQLLETQILNDLQEPGAEQEILTRRYVRFAEEATDILKKYPEKD